MTTLIKLTQVKTKVNNTEGPIFINPAAIAKIYQVTDDDENTLLGCNGATMVSMALSTGCFVKETPEEIADLIFKAEHPECKL